MSFYPVGYDYQSPTAAMFYLINISTTDGDLGFFLGGDSDFTDVNGKTWYRGTLLTAGTQELALNGIAPSGELTLSYFQDPGLPDLIETLQASGVDYVKGRPVSFYAQCFNSISHMHAPVFEPLLYMTRTAASLVYRAPGQRDRSISLTYESPGDRRRNAKNLTYTVDNHEIQIGSPDPSLEFKPSETDNEQPLFG